MMPKRRSADGTTGYDPMTLFVLSSALSLCYPVFVLFLASAREFMGITVIQRNTIYYS